MSIARVQTKHQYPATSGTAYAFASNNAAGNFIVVSVGGNSVNAVESMSVADSNGNTYHPLTGFQNTNVQQQTFYAENIAGGANSITVTSANVTDIGFTAVEYSGVKKSSSFDVEAAGKASSGSTPFPSNAFSPQAGSLIFATFNNERVVPSSITSSNLTIIQSDLGHIDAQGELLSAPAGSQTVSFDAPGESNATIVCVSCFLPELPSVASYMFKNPMPPTANQILSV